MRFIANSLAAIEDGGPFRQVNINYAFNSSRSAEIPLTWTFKDHTNLKLKSTRGRINKMKNESLGRTPYDEIKINVCFSSQIK